MKMKAPHHILLAILGLIALVLSGCGGNEDEAKALGCPSGSILANSDDQLIITTSEPATLSFYAGLNVGGIPMSATAFTFPYSTYYGPITVKVQGPFNTVRNNICVVMNSDGIFWDKDFTAVQGSVSVGYSRFVTKTDAAGIATIWWSTETVASSATYSGAVINATGADTVSATSGAAPQAYWNASYTVAGCTDPATWPVGYTCP